MLVWRHVADMSADMTLSPQNCQHRHPTCATKLDNQWFLVNRILKAFQLCLYRGLPCELSMCFARSLTNQSQGCWPLFALSAGSDATTNTTRSPKFILWIHYSSSRSPLVPISFYLSIQWSTASFCSIARVLVWNRCHGQSAHSSKAIDHGWLPIVKARVPITMVLFWPRTQPLESSYFSNHCANHPLQEPSPFLISYHMHELSLAPTSRPY